MKALVVPSSDSWTARAVLPPAGLPGLVDPEVLPSVSANQPVGGLLSPSSKLGFWRGGPALQAVGEVVGAEIDGLGDWLGGFFKE